MCLLGCKCCDVLKRTEWGGWNNRPQQTKGKRKTQSFAAKVMDRTRSEKQVILHVQGGLIHYIYSNASIAKPAFKACPAEAKDRCCGLLAFLADILSLGNLHQRRQALMEWVLV